MGSVTLCLSSSTNHDGHHISLFRIPCHWIPFLHFPVSLASPPPQAIRPLNRTLHLPTIFRPRIHSDSQSSEQGEGDKALVVEDLRVPDHWLLPSKALEESEWLRVTLHKWLDDEYCPEVTNVEISKIAARSYYNALLEKQTDLGEILLKMAGELQSISYKESFHGPFSSANAAVSLILQKIEQS